MWCSPGGWPSIWRYPENSTGTRPACCCCWWGLALVPLALNFVTVISLGAEVHHLMIFSFVLLFLMIVKCTELAEAEGVRKGGKGWQGIFLFNLALCSLVISGGASAPPTPPICAWISNMRTPSPPPTGSPPGSSLWRATPRTRRWPWWAISPWGPVRQDGARLLRPGAPHGHRRHLPAQLLLRPVHSGDLYRPPYAPHD